MKTMNRCAVLAASMVAALLSASAQSQVTGPARYRVVDLGTLNPTGAGMSRAASVSNISNRLPDPVVVGSATGLLNTAAGGLPFVWTPKTGMFEGTGGLARMGSANAVNGGGFYAGTVTLNTDGVHLTRGFFAGVFMDAVWTLPTLGGNASAANGINENSDVVGSAQNRDGVTRAAAWPAIWTNRGPIDLGTLGGDFSEASAINNNRFVVGASADRRGITRAFFTGPIGNISTPMQDLGGLWNAGTAIARDVNDMNIVVGQAQLPPLGTNTSSLGYRAVRWARVSSNTGWSILNLGTLANTHTASEALGINRSGQIVGWSGAIRTGPNTSPSNRRAFLHEDGRMIDLNSTIPASSGWILETATEINDQGYICGFGVKRLDNQGRLSQPRAFLLIPARN